MKQQINGNNPIRVLHMAPIRMGGITELVLTLSEKIDFEKVQFDYLTFEETFDQASKRAKEAHSTIYRVSDQDSSYYYESDKLFFLHLRFLQQMQPILHMVWTNLYVLF